MYRLPSIVTIEMGVLRTTPLFRPRTESRYCDPILRPRRSIATFIRTIHIGGGFTSDVPGEYARPFCLFRPASRGIIAHDMNQARLGYLVLNVGTLLLVAIAVTTLALQGHSAWFAVGAGTLLGLVPTGLIFGVTEMVAPASVIRWRAGMMSRDNDALRMRVGALFSKWLAIAGPRPWEIPTARLRVRLLGLALTAFWVVVAVTALWISYYARNVGS